MKPKTNLKGDNMEHISEITQLEYHSGNLSEDERLKVEAHTEECADCRVRLTEFKEDLRTIVSCFPQEPEEAFWASYLPRLRKRMEKRVSHVFGFANQFAAGILGAAAAALLIIFFAGGFDSSFIPMHFEEWSAVNLYDHLPVDIEVDTFNEALGELTDIKDPKFIQLSEYDIMEMMQDLSAEEVDAVFEIIKNTTII